jgi:hypothetical protein
MPEDYYQNTLYPLQDKVLKFIGELPVEFYLGGGTALSRGYLRHRYSDDLDFFVNGDPNFKPQVNTIIEELSYSGLQGETSVADYGFTRLFIMEGDCVLKLDFINDVPFRRGIVSETSIFPRTDNIFNILSNKITALGRYAARDVVDIIYICEATPFNWQSIFRDASEKDVWINPVHAAQILEQFPIEKLDGIAWIGTPPTAEWFKQRIDRIIPDILNGADNSLSSVKF